jgi:hypothetical protein
MADTLVDCCDKCHCKCCEALKLLEGVDWTDDNVSYDAIEKVVDQVIELLHECCDHCETALPVLKQLSGRRRPRPHHPKV